MMNYFKDKKRYSYKIPIREYHGVKGYGIAKSSASAAQKIMTADEKSNYNWEWIPYLNSRDNKGYLLGHLKLQFIEPEND